MGNLSLLLIHQEFFQSAILLLKEIKHQAAEDFKMQILINYAMTEHQLFIM